jgi:hypothetical protein
VPDARTDDNDPQYHKDLTTLNGFLKQAAQKGGDAAKIRTLIAQRTAMHNERMRAVPKLQPKQLGAMEEDHVKAAANARLNELAKPDARDGEGNLLPLEGQNNARTALKYMTDESARQPLVSAARAIHMYNPSIDVRQATDIAVAMTQHVRDNELGLNGRKGDKGADFHPMGRDSGGNVKVVVNVDGTRTPIMLPSSAFNSLVNMRKTTGASIKADKGRKTEQAKKEAEQGDLVNRAAKVVPNMTPSLNLPM